MSGPEDDDDTDVVVFSDEQGNELAFEVLALLDVEGQEYALLTPVTDDEEAEEDGIDVHIFRYTRGQDGEDGFADDLDEATFEKVRAAAEKMFGGEDS